MLNACNAYFSYKHCVSDPVDWLNYSNLYTARNRNKKSGRVSFKSDTNPKYPKMLKVDEIAVSCSSEYFYLQ